MTKRTIKQWQHIMQAHANYAGTTKQFCFEHNIPIQTFYSRRHAMGLATPMRSKKGTSKEQLSTAVATQSSQFVKAQVSPIPSSIIRVRR